MFLHYVTHFHSTSINLSSQCLLACHSLFPSITTSSYTSYPIALPKSPPSMDRGLGELIKELMCDSAHCLPCVAVNILFSFHSCLHKSVYLPDTLSSRHEGIPSYAISTAFLHLYGQTNGLTSFTL